MLAVLIFACSCAHACTQDVTRQGLVDVFMDVLVVFHSLVSSLHSASTAEGKSLAMGGMKYAKEVMMGLMRGAVGVSLSLSIIGTDVCISLLLSASFTKCPYRHDLHWPPPAITCNVLDAPQPLTNGRRVNIIIVQHERRLFALNGCFRFGQALVFRSELSPGNCAAGR